MSARDFYESIGENYGETFSRFGSEALIEKLVAAYAQDRTFESLERAIENGDVKSAFVSAHTLKGVAANLGFSNLAKVASEITEILRRGSLDGVAPLLAQARDIQTPSLQTHKLYSNFDWQGAFLQNIAKSKDLRFAKFIKSKNREIICRVGFENYRAIGRTQILFATAMYDKQSSVSYFYAFNFDNMRFL